MASSVASDGSEGGGASTGGAPTTSKYLLQVADASLPNAQAMGALATGIPKNTTTTGVQSIASPGVDYSKGPIKQVTKVVLGADGQVLSLPVADGENNGLIRATGFILSDGVSRSITVKINGSATGVTMQYAGAQNTTQTDGRTLVGLTDLYGAWFELVMLTAKGTGLKRGGFIRILSATTTLADWVFNAGFFFNDTSTVITSIDLDCSAAAGAKAGSYALVEEGIVA